jgi:hypothetical protein
MKSIARRFLFGVCIAAVASGSARPVRVGAQDAVPSRTISEEAAEVRTRAVERVAGLADRIAIEARSLEDPKIRLTVQVQSAALLWAQAPERSREVYVEAFESLMLPTSAMLEVRQRAESLRAELLAAVARRDPSLA